MPLPLDGVRVLDLTSIMAGPYCTTVLGDLGAEVTKLESPDGDATRKFDPKVNGESYCFAALNRNKKSICVDLKAPRGREIVLRLAARSEIVVENFRPGVAAKLGIDYESLRKVNASLIYASVSGFGQTGPYGLKGGFDIIAQGMSGIMMMTGYPGGRPAKVGIAMNDIAAAATILSGILGAYIGKLRHGGGQYLETSLLEAGLAWSIWEFGAFFGGGEEPVANGTRHRRSAPYQAYRSKDGYVTVGAGTEKLWRAFARDVVAKPEWIEVQGFRSQADRLRHADELERVIEEVLETQTTAYWVEKLDAAGVPGGPVYTYAQAMADPQVKYRRMVVDIEHPKIGMMKMPGLPLKSTGELTAIRAPAPLLGQHSRQVLCDAGYSEIETANLVADGVVRAMGEMR
jgi:crotonobetainyl-CoA:carnitine CoA-transferase CaiB-like acyl-CoA transferase